jgi:hypothetical protein
MTVSIGFFAGENFQIQDLSGSGIAFYGDSGFNASVRVGEYQGRTFISNSAGTTQGPECDNVKFLSAGSGILGQAGDGVALRAIPNYLSTLNIRAYSDDSSTFQVQDARLYIYDRYSTANPASGVTCKVVEIIHPDTNQTANGSGSTTWTTFTTAATGQYVSLCPSPGISGLYANGAGGRADSRHDWFAALSASPNTIGSKTQFGLYVSLDYL